MFISVTTNDDHQAMVNTDLITHMTVAAFSGHGSKLYFTSKDSLSVRDTLETIMGQIDGTAVAPAPAV